MSGTNARDEWLERVLGIKLRKTEGKTEGKAEGKSSGKPRPKLAPIWVTAKEKIDQDIAKLQAKILEFGDEDLEQIAEFGLFGASDGQATALLKALFLVDAGNDDALPTLRDAVQDYRDFLDGTPIVDLIEANPFKVPVPLRKTLEPALDELDRLAA